MSRLAIGFEWRAFAKLTPNELAKMVGRDEAEIESWETGRRSSISTNWSY